MILQLEETLNRLDMTEANLCRAFNRSCTKREVKVLFATVSRLGDGLCWYCLMAALLIIQKEKAIPAVITMILVGVIGLIIYKLIKTGTRRKRPCIKHRDLLNPVLPLDEFSFPSGHTLHAVGFTVAAGMYFPALLWLLVPLALLIALSRVILGLHYPSDVLAGALIGASIALVITQLPIAI